MRRRPTEHFYQRPAVEVARELVGMILQRQLPDSSLLAGRIVETEAYLGDGSDPGSHSHRGITPRNSSMFGPPGRIYVYRSYGIHLCLNVVCEAEGRGAAVLIRAVEPLTGIPSMRKLRGLDASHSDRLIARGPGRLAQAFGVEPSHDGASALGGEFDVLFSPERSTIRTLEVSRRVGLSKGANLLLRFYEKKSPWVSPWRAGKSNARGGRGARVINRPAD